MRSSILRGSVSAAVLVVWAHVVVPLSSAGGACEDLERLKLPHVIVTLAVKVRSGALALRDDALPRADSSFFTAFDKLPAFCRVKAVSVPTPASHIEFEVWLPDGWNGRYVGAGNGGSGGTINYYRLAEAVNGGYAGSSTDTGHRQSIDSKDAAIDFDHRAIHETAVNAKQMIRALYAKDAQYSYFHGCSTGGRQALTEAQLYPSDYDGIAAGAPAFRFGISRAADVSDAKLGRYKNRGGKVVLYHGERDEPAASIAYYERLVQRFGQRAVQDFVRFYVVPEMGHCGGGPVPEFGTRLWPAAEDAEHSMILALERWVERSVGPESIIATKYRVDDDWSSGVERTRPLCPYPLQVSWAGNGSRDDASSYLCMRRP